MDNASPYGLNSSIWTRSVRRGRQIARRLQTGTSNVNEAFAAAWGSVDAPMGGMKASGLGCRHGIQGILKYTQAQTIAVQSLMLIGPKSFPVPRALRQDDVSPAQIDEIHPRLALISPFDLWLGFDPVFPKEP